MPAATTKADLLAVTDREYGKLAALIAPIGEDTALHPFDDGVTIKDIIGHRAHQRQPCGLRLQRTRRCHVGDGDRLHARHLVRDVHHARAQVLLHPRQGGRLHSDAGVHLELLAVLLVVHVAPGQPQRLPRRATGVVDRPQLGTLPLRIPLVLGGPDRDR